MGSLVDDLDIEVNPVQRSKEENQERAFVAASRRKDRSLDARLESANRASMLHKKRTGKALHITKEIVEKEAMYEEVDERYQEKRLKLLKDHTNQLESQFKAHLMATMALSANNARQPRVSPYGGIQKRRNFSLPTNSLNMPNGSFLAQLPGHMGTISPPATSPRHGAPSPPESYQQTPGSSCYSQTPMAWSSYFDTGLISPSVSPRNNSFQQTSPVQSVHIGPATIAQPTPTVPYLSQHRASLPDVLMYQQQQQQQKQQQQMLPVQQAMDSSELSMTPSPTGPAQAPSTLQDNVLLSPALSSPSMTSSSSQNSGEALLTQGVQTLQGQVGGVSDYKQPLFEVSENPDPEYHEFFNYATTMDDPWQQIPMGNAPFDEFMNLEGLDLEIAQL